MPSTFTANTGIEKIADGEQTGLWGQTTNLNLDIVDRALNGVGVITLTGTTHTLVTSNGVLTDGQFAVLVFTGALSAPNTVTIAPNTQQKTFWVRNITSQNVIMSQGSGGNVTVPPGVTKAIYANGAGAGAQVVDMTAVFVGDVTGNVTGNADTATLAADATKLATTRAFTIGATARNFDGSGPVTWSISDINAQLNALAALATNGLITRTGTNTVAARNLTGTANQIAVTNGDGVSGNPTVSAVVADKATAEAGTDNTRLMTPLRTNEAIAALGGKVLQVSHGSFISEVNISSTSYTSSGLSRTITPRSTSSQILVLVSQSYWLQRDANADATARGGFSLFRGETEIMTEANFGLNISGGDAANSPVLAGRWVVQRLDTPNTTSPVTYSVRGRLATTADNAILRCQQFGTTDSFITLMEIAG
jgi:hypothetical protein